MVNHKVYGPVRPTRLLKLITTLVHALFARTSLLKRAACFRGRRGFLRMTTVSRVATPFLAVDRGKKTTFRRENR